MDVSGDGRRARLKGGAQMRSADELGGRGQIREIDGLRQQHHGRRRKQHCIGDRHRGADGADVTRMLARTLIGRRLRRRQVARDLNSKVVVGSNAVEVAERQRKLDRQRKQRDVRNAFDVRPEPLHADMHLTPKARAMPILLMRRKFREFGEMVSTVAP